MNQPHIRFLCRKCYVEAATGNTPLVTTWVGNCQKCEMWEPLYTHRSLPVLYLKA